MDWDTYRAEVQARKDEENEISLAEAVARAIALSSRSWREWHEVPASSKDAFRCNAKHAIAAYRSWHKTWQVRLGANGKDEELARSIQRYFLLDARRQIVWGPDYNQAARDVYERACRYLGEEPIAIES